MSFNRCLSLAVLGLSAVAVDAYAQSRSAVQPSITSGLVFDNNIFLSEERVDDMIWRVTPALVVTRETPFGSFLGRYGFDAERYRTQTDLTTMFARQDASISVTTRPGVSTSATFEAGIDSTLRPSELNLSTQLATGRRRAWRVYASPEVKTEVAPRVTLVARYDFLLDILRPRLALTTTTPPATTPPVTPPSTTPPSTTPAPGIDDTFDLLPAEGLTVFTHEAQFRTEYGLTERDQFRAGYRLQQFRSESDPLITVHVPTAGYARRIGPSTRLTLDAGPRFALGAIDAEVEATLAHTYRDVLWTLTYARTLASSIGVTEIVNVDRVLTGVRYANQGDTEVAMNLGFFRSAAERSSLTPDDVEIGRGKADVYQASASVTQRLGGALSVVASVAWDLQRGRLGFTPVDITGMPTAVPRIQRQVAFVQLMLAPRIRPLPKDEDKEPTGRARPGDRSKR